ncbi:MULTISPECIES: hypothetical protein [Paraburkholderia]|jgi:hypothetical protein|uniref:Uncharacterized protein n=1 Tax=Paraburkholderia madseniana TaxID=2599607 RepID=A0AAP5BI32_9BURK|nr:MULTISPECIES: hypothetical protein [Paraburkholderia]MCX4150129.1 hypothetical protein [Paraburkholderia madseniana]MDN7153064.1 hypothetical protein [Paraburkholderia sp. WS6]MDQ6411946.1 hypothetical protein [Paraburkholderia madseniana]
MKELSVSRLSGAGESVLPRVQEHPDCRAGGPVRMRANTPQQGGLNKVHDYVLQRIRQRISAYFVQPPYPTDHGA